MKKLYKERLLKLADHISDKSKRGHKEFDFGTVSRGEINTCGSAGCAMGECPIAFPKSFEFRSGRVRLKKNSEQWMDSDISKFFGIRQSQLDHLFYPGLQETELYGGKVLHANATAKQVAKNIRIFVDRV